MSERLYYSDSYCQSFRARVIERSADGRGIVLDRTAFYPSSGGQPYDLGRISGLPIQDVIDQEDRVVHLLAEPLSQDEVECAIDWPRRFDHMQQHTGQHLLSAVFAELFGHATVSFHMGAVASTIDLACPAVSRDQIEAVEARANQIVHENRAVTIAIEDSATAGDLRKPTDRSGPIRVIAIEGLDRSACGGTHVRATGEIGAILIRSQEKIRGHVRLEFVCGSRAIERARADYNALEQSARQFSASLQEVPSLISAQAEKLKWTDKRRWQLEVELAEHRGRALYAETPANLKGIRFHTRILAEGSFPEDLRAEASAFVSGGRAVFLALTERPAAVMLACSADSGVHAGNLLKQLFSELGGKGGGSAQMAQGSLSGDTSLFIDRVRAILSVAE